MSHEKDTQEGIALWVAKSYNSRLAKHLGIDEDSEWIGPEFALSYTKAGTLSDGAIKLYSLRNDDPLKDLAKRLEKSQRENHHLALMSAQPKPDRLPKSNRDGWFAVTTRASSEGGAPAIARIKENFFWPSGVPAVMFFDHDGLKHLGDFETLEEASRALWDQILDLVPEFCDAGILSLASSGSLITVDGTNVRALESAKSFMFVDDGSMIPKIANLLEFRAWKAGLGRIDIATDASRLVRNNLFDTSIYSEERLLYIAGAVNDCPERIEQQLPGPFLYQSGGVLKTGGIPTVSNDDLRQLRIWHDEARIDASPRAEKQKLRMAREKARKKGISVEAAYKAIDRLSDGGILCDDDKLYCNDGQTRTVKDIFIGFDSLPAGLQCADPADPTCGNGSKTKAYINKNEQICRRANVFSFAHGGRVFEMCLTFDVMKQVAERAEVGWLRENLPRMAQFTHPDQTKLQTAEIVDIVKGRLGKFTPISDIRDAYDVSKFARSEISEVDATDDIVEFVNQKHFAAHVGQKILFFREPKAPGDPPRAMNKDAFLFEYKTQTIKVGDSEMPLAEYWMRHPERRFYRDGMELDPERANPDAYQLWRGFGVDPKQGDWTLIKAHIYDVLANGNRELGDYILRWAAWVVQHPADVPRVALVFRGDEGVGKGFFGNMLVRIFGAHGMRVQHMGHLTGKFNAHQQHLCLMYGDEVISADPKEEGALKGIITEPTIPIEMKGVDVYQVENHMSVVMTSNQDHVVPAGIGARRFVVFDVPSTRKDDDQYFGPLYKQLGDGGIEATLYDLINLDLGDWHPAISRPNTQALVDQKVRSLEPLKRFLYDVLQEGEFPIGVVETNRVFTSKMAEAVNRIHLRANVSSRTVSDLLKDLGLHRDNGRPRGFYLPPLGEMRRMWDLHFFQVDWNPEIADWSHNECMEPESLLPV